MDITKNYIYDLEIMVPVSSYGVYAKRAEDFKQYGLVNNKYIKTKVKFLVGPKDTFPDINFRENVDFEVFYCKNHSAVQKIYEYYLSLTEEQLNTTRWFAKVDDDSITDIAGLVENLDDEFDWEKEYYIVTELNYDYHGFEIQLLKEFGYEKWFLPGSMPILHEWEMCVVSQVAMKKILLNEITKQFFKRRILSAQGPGDVALAAVARIQKIHIVKANFISKNPDLKFFSAFGGALNHIHFISHDKNGHLMNIFKDFVDKKENLIGKEQTFNLVGKTYAFWRKITNVITEDGPLILDCELITTLRINKYGFLEAHHNNESFWEFKNNKLYFLDQNFNPTAIFSKHDKNFDLLEGYYFYDINTKYYLTSSLKSPDIKEISLL